MKEQWENQRNERTIRGQKGAKETMGGSKERKKQ